MHLTDLYDLNQLHKALDKKYGPGTLLKTSETKNQDGEDVITVTIVRKEEPYKGYTTSPEYVRFQQATMKN